MPEKLPVNLKGGHESEKAGLEMKLSSTFEDDPRREGWEASLAQVCEILKVKVPKVAGKAREDEAEEAEAGEAEKRPASAPKEKRA